MVAFPHRLVQACIVELSLPGHGGEKHAGQVDRGATACMCCAWQGKPSTHYTRADVSSWVQVSLRLQPGSDNDNSPLNRFRRSFSSRLRVC